MPKFPPSPLAERQLSCVVAQMLPFRYRPRHDGTAPLPAVPRDERDGRQHYLCGR